MPKSTRQLEFQYLHTGDMGLPGPARIPNSAGFSGADLSNIGLAVSPSSMVTS